MITFTKLAELVEMGVTKLTITNKAWKDLIPEEIKMDGKDITLHTSNGPITVENGEKSE